MNRKGQKHKKLTQEEKTVSYFFLAFVCTILFVRTYLFFKPTSSPLIGDFQTHHYLFGLIGLVLGLVINSLITFAIGFALFVDEITFLLIGGEDHQDYYSLISLLGTLALVVIIYFVKDHIPIPKGKKNNSTSR